MSKMTIKEVMALQDHYIKAGIIRDPKTYSAQELKELCPNVPGRFIDDWVDVRDGKKLKSDWKRRKLNIKDI